MMKGSLVALLVCSVGVALAASPRLPRTSADQRSIRNVGGSGSNATVNTLSANGPRSSQRNREQYLFNVFEVIVSTLESKLQRIENLDKAVEHLMRRVEALDSRVTDNIDKTDSVITKLRSLDLKLFSGHGSVSVLTPETIYATGVPPNESGIKQQGSVATIRLIEPEIDQVDHHHHHHHQQQRVGSEQDQVEAADELPSSLPIREETLGEKLLSLGQKVSDIDNKLVDLKNQLDSNFLQNDDINAEASEKKPVSMSVIEITKAMSNEVMNHVTIEIENLRQASVNMDRKFQFHMNLVGENMGALYNMITDIHEALVGRTNDATTATLPGEGILKEKVNLTKAPTPNDAPFKQSKADRLVVEHVYPTLTVSEKMDQVWNMLVGTKTSLDDLLPKSDQLLNQTQRQERAIHEIQEDLRSKTNKIIENLEGVENRLKKQENDVASFAQRPIPAELLLDPTIDRLIEYDPNRYDEIKIDEFSTEASIATSSSSASSATSPTSSSIATGPTIVTPGLTLGSAGSLSAGVSLSTPAGATISTVTSVTSPTTAAAPVPAPAVTTTTIPSAGSSTFSGNVSTVISSTASTLNSTGFQRTGNKSRAVIFPSVKNKPSPANSTFVSDVFLNLRDVKGYSCVDLLNAGMRESGVYYLQIRGTTYWFLKVYCEQDVADGGWTVIQRRDDFGEPRENFNRDWADYKNGFGDPAREFWLGNENIYMLTNNEDYMLRVELEDFEGNKRYAQYNHFKIYSEAEYYKLEIDGYDGNAGDSLNDPWYGSNNSPFSTYNRDNDRSSLNCASMLKGGWWWKSCGRGLNGLYLNDPQDLTARQGIVWFRWRGWDYTLKRAIMMIKPKGPSTNTSTNI